MSLVGLVRIAAACSLALTLVLTVDPRTAAALSCPDYAAVLESVDLVVTGRVLPDPFPGVVLLWTDGYQKSGGRKLLVAEVTAGHWSNRPRAGSAVLMGFHREGFSLVNGPCSPYVELGPANQAASQPWLDRLGPASAPAFGIGVHSGRSLWYMLALTGAALLLWRRLRQSGAPG